MKYIYTLALAFFLALVCVEVKAEKMDCKNFFQSQTMSEVTIRAINNQWEDVKEGIEIDINKIIMIESSGNPHAYNEKSGAIGLTQITSVVLEEYNTLYLPTEMCWNRCFNYMGNHGNNCYAFSPDDCVPRAGYNFNRCKEQFSVSKEGYSKDSLYNAELNVLIGTWYINTRIPQMLKAYGIEDTVENRLIAYHDGILNLKKYLEGKRKLGKNMKAYLRKYKEGR